MWRHSHAAVMVIKNANELRVPTAALVPETAVEVRLTAGWRWPGGLDIGHDVPQHRIDRRHSMTPAPRVIEHADSAPSWCQPHDAHVVADAAGVVVDDAGRWPQQLRAGEWLRVRCWSPPAGYPDGVAGRDDS
jgi:hypothetical protein